MAMRGRGGGMDTIRWFETGKDKIDVKLFGWKSLAEMQAAGVTMTSGKDSSGAAFEQSLSTPGPHGLRPNWISMHSYSSRRYSGPVKVASTRVPIVRELNGMRRPPPGASGGSPRP